jgi:hypothetical protein
MDHCLTARKRKSNQVMRSSLHPLIIKDSTMSVRNSFHEKTLFLMTLIPRKMSLLDRASSVRLREFPLTRSGKTGNWLKPTFKSFIIELKCFKLRRKRLLKRLMKQGRRRSNYLKSRLQMKRNKLCARA